MNFIWDRKHRIGFNADREFIVVAVVNDSASRADVDRPLLLVLSTRLEVGRMDDLKRIEAGSDSRSPKPHDGYQEVHPPNRNSAFLHLCPLSLSLCSQLLLRSRNRQWRVRIQNDDLA